MKLVRYNNQNSLAYVFSPLVLEPQYLMALSAYDIEVGCAKKGFALLPDSDLKNGFTTFCKECWQASIDLVTAIHERQRMRNEK